MYYVLYSEITFVKQYAATPARLFMQFFSQSLVCFHKINRVLTVISFSQLCRSVMSWDSYIDNLMGHSKLGDTCQIDKACIIGRDGSAWTTAGHACALVLSDEERQKISSEVAKRGNHGFAVSGIKAGGIKYQFLRYDDENEVYLGKKKGEGSITLQGSKSAVVIAHTYEGGQQGNSNKAVGVIAEYLTSLGM